MKAQSGFCETCLKGAGPCEDPIPVVQMAAYAGFCLDCLTEGIKLLQASGVIEIVINNCHGGFGLSPAARDFIGIENDYDIERDDPRLILAVKELGSLVNGSYADLSVVQIPAGVLWEICEYDGAEWVAEKHRRWE